VPNADHAEAEMELVAGLLGAFTGALAGDLGTARAPQVPGTEPLRTSPARTKIGRVDAPGPG
jgi:hypothetical protein